MHMIPNIILLSLFGLTACAGAQVTSEKELEIPESDAWNIYDEVDSRWLHYQKPELISAQHIETTDEGSIYTVKFLGNSYTNSSEMPASRENNLDMDWWYAALSDGSGDSFSCRRVGRAELSAVQCGTSVLSSNGTDIDQYQLHGVINERADDMRDISGRGQVTFSNVGFIVNGAVMPGSLSVDYDAETFQGGAQNPIRSIELNGTIDGTQVSGQAEYQYYIHEPHTIEGTFTGRVGQFDDQDQAETVGQFSGYNEDGLFSGAWYGKEN